MAHATRINDLVNGLVRSIARGGRQDESLGRITDKAAKGLRHGAHARTNQFDIQAKLHGLVEKFAVLNRDDIAEALRSRLEELPTESKWMPEILSLLLQLSDRPLQKTKLEDGEALAKPAEAEQAELTWADIIADDPFNEPDIWDDVERGYHSSGDEAPASEEADSDETTSTLATSIGGNDLITFARLHILQPNDTAVDELQATRQHFDLSTSLSELTLLRETLLMLHGLPTSIYIPPGSEQQVSLKQVVKVETAAATSGEDCTFAWEP